MKFRYQMVCGNIEVPQTAHVMRPINFPTKQHGRDDSRIEDI